MPIPSPYSIAVARPDQYTAIGELLVQTYSALPGMPRILDQPEYYARLRDVGARASNAAITVYVALSAAGDLLGSVDFIHSMDQYGSGGSATTVADAAGIRLLAVAEAYRGGGMGKRLTGVCIERAAAMGKSQVILHTTRAMATAWTMYERLGFVRSEDLDFMQGELQVYGFRLRLAHRQARLEEMPTVVSELQAMLRTLSPTLDETEYVFVSAPDRSGLERLSAFMRGFFVEEEGVTFIIPSEVARAHGLPDEPSLRRIVLNVHSSLEAVGLTARVSSALAGAGVPCNMVAAFHHDHVFVPQKMALHALEILRGIQGRAIQDDN